MSDDAAAIQLADKLRRDHNGIFRVDIYLGHDGDNVCRLGDYDNPIGYGCASTLYEAVRRAATDWRYRLLASERQWARDKVATYAEEASGKFGAKTEGLFNTACFQTAINAGSEYDLTDELVKQLLLEHPRIVRLAGGCHWLLLPYGLEKFKESAQP